MRFDINIGDSIKLAKKSRKFKGQKLSKSQKILKFKIDK